MRPVQFETILPHHLVELMTHTLKTGVPVAAAWGSVSCRPFPLLLMLRFSPSEYSAHYETVLTGRFKIRKSRLHLNLELFPCFHTVETSNTQYKRWM